MKTSRIPLAALAPLLLLATPAWAQDNQAAGLFTKARQLPLVEQSVRVSVVGAEARLHVVQVFANDGEDVGQADYRLDLPRDATVTSFGFWQGGRLLTATLKRKDEAERAHARAASSGRATGLMKKSGRALTHFSVYPVAAGERKRVELEVRMPVDVEAGQSSVRIPIDRFLGQAPVLSPVVVSVRTADRLVALGADGAAVRVVERAATRGTLVLTSARAVDVWWRVQAPPLLVRAERTALDGADGQGIGVTIALNDGARLESAATDVHVVLDGSFSMRRHKRALLNMVRRLRARGGERVSFHAVAETARNLPGTPEQVVTTALDGAVGHSTTWTQVASALTGLRCADAGIRCAVVTDAQLQGAAEAAKAEVPVVFLAAPDELAYAGAAIGETARVFRPGTDPDRALYRLADELVLPTLHLLGIEAGRVPLAQLGRVRPIVPEGSALRVYSDMPVDDVITVLMTIDGREIERILAPTDLPTGSPESAALRRAVYREKLAGWMKAYDASRDDGLREQIITASIREEIPTTLTSLHVEDPALSLYAIKPGDPLLKVPAEPGLREVLAFYPFGESRRLVKDEANDRFVDRFLVPRRWAERGYRVDVFKVYDDGRVAKADVWYKLDERGPDASVSIDLARAALVVGTPGETRQVGAVTILTDDGRTLRLSPVRDEWRADLAELGERFTVVVRDRAGNTTSFPCRMHDGRLYVTDEGEPSSSSAAAAVAVATRPLDVVAGSTGGARVDGRTIVVTKDDVDLRFSRDDADLRSLVVTALEPLGRGRWLLGTRAGNLVRLDCKASGCRARALSARFRDHPVTGIVHLRGERALVGVLGQGLWEARAKRVVRSRLRVGSRFVTGVEPAGKALLVGTAYNGLWRVTAGRAMRTRFPHDHVAALRTTTGGVLVASGHGRWLRQGRDRFLAVGGPVPGADGSARFIAATAFAGQTIVASFDRGLFVWRDGALTPLPVGLPEGAAQHLNALLAVDDRLFVASETGLYRVDAGLRRAVRILDVPTYGLARAEGTVAAVTKRGVFVGPARGELRRIASQTTATTSAFNTVSFHHGGLYVGGLDGLFRVDGWRAALAGDGGRSLSVRSVKTTTGGAPGWVTALLSDGPRLLVGTYDEGVLEMTGRALSQVAGLGDSWVPFHGLYRAGGALFVGGLGMAPARVTGAGVERLWVPARDVFAVVDVPEGVLLLTDEGAVLAPARAHVASR